ncbi:MULTISPECIES: protease modulator HflC [Modicisalibacter]|uniref:protease modulator HflC n=1 Tax=Modicisalibacter TaxID=574347 RepID=UPI00100C20C6|nr:MULTISPECIES: protease modulator HflC [Halomonadaceae]MBZ9557422.1 protease modulator HflC [Modicisalibacter sp. R2A 31.J]MBZ9573912.1 protease modulator HflC [Modicisalibacter sp. MOD 31.J]
MINNRSLLIVAGVAVVAWVGSNSLYIVNETERAIKLRFGEIVEANIQPGLHFKVPITNTVRTFDARVLTLDTDTSRYLTLEKKAVIVDSYVKWKIVDPARYYEATSGNEQAAERLISPRVDEALRNQFGKLELQEIIAERRDELMSGPTQELDKIMRKELGVAILDIRIKRIDLPDEVTQAVYERMRTERHREAREYRAQGQEQAEKIRANAERRRQVLLAEAQSKSETLRGQGDGEAASIYAQAYQQDAEFFRFYRSLDAYRNSFDGKDDLLVLEPDSDFFRYLNSPAPQPAEGDGS